MQVTEEMIEKAAEAFSKATAWYPDNDVYGAVTEWFRLDSQDAVDFGVLKEPKWDGISDIRGMQHEWYVAAVVKEPMRAALTAALSDKQAVEVKALEWHGDGDCYAFAEVTHTSYSIAFEEGRYWANWNVALPPFDTLDDAKAAAQSDYDQRIRAALVAVPAVEPDWWLVTTEMGKVIFHGPDKDRAERVAAMRGRPVTPLYASPTSRNALDKERGG